MSFQSFLKCKGTPVEITFDDGSVRPINFYPVSVQRVVGLRDMAAGLARSVASLLSTDPYKDFSRTVQSDEQKGIKVSTSEPPTGDLIELRRKQLFADIDGIVNSLLAPENARVVASLVIDSMRDEYGDAERNSPSTVDSFLSEVSATVFSQLVKGVMKANSKLFSPLAEKLAAIRTAASKRLDEKMEDLTGGTGPKLRKVEDSETPS